MVSAMRRKAYALMPSAAQRGLADLAVSSSLGRKRLNMLLQSLEAFGCDRFALDATLSRVRRLADFPAVAAAEAETWLARGREARRTCHTASARTYLEQATLFFALADWMAEGSFKRANFGRLIDAADALRELASIPTRRVSIAGCPAYWRMPATFLPGSGPCVVIVQGTNSSRDMFFSLEEMLLARGAAVLNVDQPGTGECLLLGRHLRDLEDLRPFADGIFEFLAGEAAALDWQVGVFGFSLGGFVAPALCALEPRFGAAAMVATGLRADASLLDALPPQLKARAMSVAGVASWDAARAIALRALDLELLAAEVRCPVWAFHGERDAILPVAGAADLIARLGSPHKRLSVMPGGDHTCSATLRTSVLPQLFDWLADTLRHAKTAS